MRGRSSLHAKSAQRNRPRFTDTTAPVQVGHDNRSDLMDKAREYLDSLKGSDGLELQDQREVLLNLLPKMSDWDLEVSMSKGKVVNLLQLNPLEVERQRITVAYPTTQPPRRRPRHSSSLILTLLRMSCLSLSTSRRAVQTGLLPSSCRLSSASRSSCKPWWLQVLVKVSGNTLSRWVLLRVGNLLFHLTSTADNING